MKTEWDYTNLADAYLKRPEYAQKAINQMVEKAKLSNVSEICDVGAGAAHLTLMLACQGYNICAVEPNDAMRKNGIERTSKFTNVQWFEGVGENTGMESGRFDLVTFGSSFNVCDRQAALKESYRILKPHGYFACMWNHRVLDDALQQSIEQIIKKQVPDYDYGSRREDQTETIDASNLFEQVEYIQENVVFQIPVQDFIDGWKSHGTLHRQSEQKFCEIITQIAAAVRAAQQDKFVRVPYTTRIWMAQKR